MRYKLKSLRIQLGLTQEYVASELSISRSAYTNIENGNKNPSLELGLKIKILFNYKSDDIFLKSNVP